jgi:hypothetical protein
LKTKPLPLHIQKVRCNNNFYNGKITEIKVLKKEVEEPQEELLVAAEPQVLYKKVENNGHNIKKNWNK